MSTPFPGRGNLLAVTFLLLLAILFEQYGIAPFFPWTNAAGSFRLMVVFLDIPLALPDIDWLPVSILFAILYCIAVGPRLSRAGQPLRRSTWKALTGWWLFLACTAAGGGLYYVVQDYLPKQVSNGIDSFGVRADLTLPWPSGGLVHLHGSMCMLVFALLGGYIMGRRIAIPQPAPTVAGVATVGAAAVAEAQAIINSPVPAVKTPVVKTPPPATKTPVREPVLAGEPEPPAAWKPAPRRTSISVTMPSQHPVFPGEPPTCRLTTPPPIAMVMPRPAPGIGKVHPCIVIGSLKPTAAK